MLTVQCVKCSALVPLQGGRKPPWCPQCGSSIGSVTDPHQQPASPAGAAPEAAAPAAAATAGDPPPSGLEAIRRPVIARTVRAECWKQYSCAACGCRYRVEHAAEGEGSTDE